MLARAASSFLFKPSCCKHLEFSIFTLVCRYASVTAAMVKQLRELTGAPMMDCKKALQHEGVDGDMDKAVEILRKQGMKRVNKVSSRSTQQGVIASHVEENKASLVEVRNPLAFLKRNVLFIVVL